MSVGAMGTGNELVGVSKIAKSVIGPLADYEVSVLCMSTYQSDFILVSSLFFISFSNDSAFFHPGRILILKIPKILWTTFFFFEVR